MPRIVISGSGGGGTSGDTPVYFNKLPFGADHVEGTQISPVQESYDYKVGGALGTTVATADVFYQDAFKDFVQSVTITV